MPRLSRIKRTAGEGGGRVVVSRDSATARRTDAARKARTMRAERSERKWLEDPGNGKWRRRRALLGKIIPLALFTSFINIHLRGRKSGRKGGRGWAAGISAGRNHAGHKSSGFRGRSRFRITRRPFVAVWNSNAIFKPRTIPRRVPPPTSLNGAPRSPGRYLHCCSRQVGSRGESPGEKFRAGSLLFPSRNSLLLKARARARSQQALN